MDERPKARKSPKSKFSEVLRDRYEISYELNGSPNVTFACQCQPKAVTSVAKLHMDLSPQIAPQIQNGKFGAKVCMQLPILSAIPREVELAIECAAVKLVATMDLNGKARHTA